MRAAALVRGVTAGERYVVKRRVQEGDCECRKQQTGFSVTLSEIYTQKKTHILTPGCNPNCSSVQSSAQPLFDHTWSRAQLLRDCSSTSHSYCWSIIYCCFTHFAYTINYGCWDAGFIFSAKSHVDNSFHPLTFSSWHDFLINSMFLQHLLPIHSPHNSTLMRAAFVFAMTAQRHVGWCQWAKFAYLSMMTGSDGVSFLLPQLFLSQHRLWGGRRRDRGGLVTDMWTSETSYKVGYSTERERKSEERCRKGKEDYKGRETLDLDFCRASRGKTGALVLQ